MAVRDCVTLGQKLLRSGVRHRILGLFGLTRLLAVVVAGAVAFADIPDSGVVHSCYDRDRARVRVVANSGCEARPGGRPGPPRAAGPAGPQGPRGPAGMSGFEVVTARMPLSGFNSDNQKQATALCPAAKRVVGTGADLETDSGDVAGRVALEQVGPVGIREVRAAAPQVPPGSIPLGAARALP